MKNLKIGALYTITDKHTGEVTTIQIRQTNPIKNWFNICGDKDMDRRLINNYIWLKVSTEEFEQKYNRKEFSEGYDYGEEIGNSVLRLSFYEAMKQEVFEKTNMLGAMEHIRDKNKLPPQDMVKCIDGIFNLKREIETCNNYIGTVVYFATILYN